jgi:hypothetical protein
VRLREPSCPFCAASLADAPRFAPPDTTRRLSRAAAFVFGASVALVACGEDVETSSTSDQSAATSGSNAASTGSGGMGGDGAGGMSTGGMGTGGMGSGGDANGSGGIGPLYGAPP